MASAKIACTCATHSWRSPAPAARAQWWNHFSVATLRMSCRFRCGRRWTFRRGTTIIGRCLRMRRLPFSRCPWCMRESIVFSMPYLPASIMRFACWGIVSANWGSAIHWNRMNVTLINTTKSLNWYKFTSKLISSHICSPNKTPFGVKSESIFIYIYSFVYRNIQDCQNIFNVILFIQVVQTVVGLSFTSVGLLHVSVPSTSNRSINRLNSNTRPQIDPFSFAFVSTFSILCLIGYQTFLYCWLGSNIINSVRANVLYKLYDVTIDSNLIAIVLLASNWQYHDLSTNCFFANFAIFNKRSKLALLLMMQLTAARPKSIVGESVLRFVFSMETFVTVCPHHPAPSLFGVD